MEDTNLFLLHSPESTSRDTTSKIITNYYPMACRESKRTKTVTYNFQGRVNDPNLVIHPHKDTIMGKWIQNYQAMELCLCPSKETLSEFPFLRNLTTANVDGAIVITHRPLTNGPILYSCFLLKNSAQSVPKTQPLEALFQFRDSMKHAYQNEPFYLEMNPFAARQSPQQLETEFEGRPCVVVVYPNALPVHFPKMTVVGGEAPKLLLGGGESEGARRAAPTMEGFGTRSPTVVEGATTLSNIMQLDMNGNPKQYGAKVGSCSGTTQSAPDLSNLPKVESSYSGNPVKQVPDAKISSDARCKFFDQGLQNNINDKEVLQGLVNEVFEYRKENDGLNPYLGNDGTTDCYQAYMDNFWMGEQNFLNYLNEKKVVIPPQYNYWNPIMLNNGFSPASIYYNLEALCYDVSTSRFNVGRAQSAGYNVLSETGAQINQDISNVANMLYSTATGIGSTTLDIITGNTKKGCSPTVGPSVILQVPIIDSPDITYQECTMIPAEDSEMLPVYMASDTQYFVKYNSLIGIIFYFILFLLIYFGTPFLYYFVMCKLLKHGFNYSGTATFADFMRKPQNVLGLGKHRGVSVLFNAVFWFIVIVIFLNTYIPGADINKLNSVIILMIIGWIIGYIGIKNNQPPESCLT